MAGQLPGPVPPPADGDPDRGEPTGAHHMSGQRVALLRQVAEIANISDDFTAAATATLGALTGPHSVFDVGHLSRDTPATSPVADAHGRGSRADDRNDGNDGGSASTTDSTGATGNVSGSVAACPLEATDVEPDRTPVWVRRRTLSPRLSQLERARAERAGRALLDVVAPASVDHSEGGVAWCTHREVGRSGWSAEPGATAEPVRTTEREGPEGPVGPADGPSPWFARVGVRTVAVIPVTVGREVVARLELYSRAFLPYDDELTEVLETVGRLLGRVVERQRAGEQSRSALSRLRALTESAPEPVIALDSQGTIVEWNAAARELFGWTAEQVIGKGLHVLVPQDLASRYVPNFLLLTAQARHPVRLGPVELLVQHADGAQVPVEGYVGPWEQAGQAYYSVFLRDVRVRHQAEEAIQDRRAALLSQAHAVEINDSVVQGLAMVVYALEAEEDEQALTSARATLKMARTMVRELLAVGDGQELAEQLLRRKPAAGYMTADRPGQGPEEAGVLDGNGE